MSKQPQRDPAPNALAYDRVLGSVRVRSTIFYRASLRSPWGFRVPPSSVAAFHLVVSGSCHAQLSEPGAAGQALRAGDLVVVPRGDGHALTDGSRGRALPLAELLRRSPPDAARELRFGGDGSETVLICGCFELPHVPTHPLAQALPRLLHVGTSQSTVGWLRSTQQFLASEFRRHDPGNAVVLDRLADILFVLAIRHHLQERRARDGWLAALVDPKLGRTLAALHQRPGDAWTLDALARVAGMSRSAFSQRFRELVGQSPMQYATRWRMQHAASLLSSSSMSVAEVAACAGYASEASFSKVFKRWIGKAPGRYRLSRPRAS